VDWQGLLHNRWVWIGGAAAGGLGLAVYLRRKNAAGGASQGAGAQASPAYSAGSVGGFDSTGTDVAAWLGNYSGNLQTQLNQYQQQLTDSLAALQNAPTTPAGTGTPTAGPSTGPAPGGITPNAARFINSNGTLSIGANQPLAAAAGSVGLTLDQLKALNPTIFRTNTQTVGGQPYSIRGMPYKIS